MKMKFLPKYTRMTAGILLLYSLASCTYDYFVDENNLWIYVPQVKEGTIRDFYIAFHDEAGSHMRSSHIYAPFNKNELMLDGTLRFKLKPGETSVTCFAQIGDMPVSEGQLYSDSYLSAKPLKGAEHTFTPLPAGSKTGTQNKSTATGKPTDPDQPRFSKTRLSLYPIGHPDAKKIHTIDISEENSYNGKITNEFKNFAGLGVTRIEIHYTGLATRLCFDGHFDNFTPQDKIQVSYDLPAAGQAGPDYSFSESYFPSSGYDIDAPDAPGTALTPLNVVTYFYDDNEIIGRFAFDSGNLNDGGMEPPVDENGDKIDGPVYLTPGAQLTFTYKGFTLVAIKLSEWGDIGSGGTTDM